jgi:acyl CoA:acetate/3-ketoacid CoA transferase alpha subunit
MDVVAEGNAEYLKVDPDAFREWVRDHKSRALESKIMSEQDAVAKLVEDGDYIVWDCSEGMRGPMSLLREIIRQKKKDMWCAGKFTFFIPSMLVAAGCISKADMGFFVGWGVGINKAVQEGRLKVFEYGNTVMTMRLKAGALGLPYMPMRILGGTDTFRYSAGRLIEDPFTGNPLVAMPALNPDVAIIHVHQADVYGNARVFGTGTAHVESALASRKVILSTEEIIETEEIRRDPGRTAIPYYAVDAVVHAPFGAYPGECAGYYASDTAHIIEVAIADRMDTWDQYLEKWVYSASSHEEMLDKRVGMAKLKELLGRATIKEGYRA